MSEILEADPRQSCILESRQEISLPHVAVVDHRFAGLLREDQVRLAPRTRRLPLLRILQFLEMIGVVITKLQN